MILEHKIYNPASQPKEWLIDHFVVRTKVFEKIFKDIREAKMKYPEQHYLIQGQRGMGKTTLLLRLKYEIENSADLNGWLVPVFFNEESYDLTSLSNLWEKLLKYLDNLWDTDGTYYKQTDEFLGKSDYEKKCFNLLIEILNKEKKKLTIFFDNFGQLFLDNLKKKDQQRLREVLMNCPDLRFIGASAVVMDELYDYSKPFFEFFKIINLEGLTKEETLELIGKLEEKEGKQLDLEKNKAKIETLAILSGGVIRTIMLIYEVILTDADGTALRDLEMILDKITPLYKHRIEDLPIQQRKIVDVIAKEWDAISTKEIAENIRDNGQPMQTKLISAQLQQLEKNNVIEKKQTNTKNHLYQLKERFFNIWYLMRNGDRNDKCRVIWLTRYLEMFYDSANEFQSFLKDHIEHLRSGKYHPTSALTLSEALANSNKIDVMSLDKILKETSSILNEEQKKLLPDITDKKISSALELKRNGKIEESIEILNSIDTRTNFINFNLATAYLRINDMPNTIKILNLIIPRTEKETRILGDLYFLCSNFLACIDVLKNYDGEEKPEVALTLGKCYEAIRDFEKSIFYYKQAVDLKNKEAYILLIKILRYVNSEEVEKYYLQIIEFGTEETRKELIEMFMYSDNINEQRISRTIINNEFNKNQDDPDWNYFQARLLLSSAKNDIDIKIIMDYAKRANELYLGKGIYSPNYHYNLQMLLGISVEILINKDEAIHIVHNIKEISMFPPLVLRRSFVNIWANKYKEGIIDFLTFANNLNWKDFKDIDTNEILLLLLSKKQYHSVLNLFAMENLHLKDKLKPVYYALMHYLKGEFPNEHLKMGDELKQPVADVMKRVEEMAIEYA